jgi:integrase
MAGAVNHAKIDTPTARSRLAKGRQPHWQSLVRGKVHLGYQRWKGDEDGRWVLRRYIGSYKNSGGKIVAKYRSETLGRADDARDANGVDVLSHEQADAKARAMVGAPTNGKAVALTVRQAINDYIDSKRALGKPVGDLNSRTRAHILPVLGDLVVAELKTKRLREWLADMATSRAQKRPRDGQPQYKAEPTTEEDVRRRRASANRVLAMLKAALNHAYDEADISTRDTLDRGVWGRNLKPFEDTTATRDRYFTIDEVRRLHNAAAPDFRPLLQAALETGCRYGELTRLQVQDFNPDTGKVTVQHSKKSATRHVTLTPEGAEFFRRHCAGRPRTALMFTHANGTPWKPTEQGRPMREACKNARIEPAVGFHTTRHTWASYAVMNDTPLMVVARNLGHKDTTMVERHYANLKDDYIDKEIRAGAPVYGIKDDQRVTTLR